MAPRFHVIAAAPLTVACASRPDRAADTVSDDSVAVVQPPMAPAGMPHRLDWHRRRPARHRGRRRAGRGLVLGNVTRNIESENESRQFVWFANQPPWMTLRLDYTGIFPEGHRETTRYQLGARIFSIAIEQ